MNDTLTANRLEILDDQDIPRIILDGGTIQHPATILFPSDGEPHVRITADTHRSAFELHNQGGSLVLEVKNGMPKITLKSNNVLLIIDENGLRTINLNFDESYS